MSAPLPRRANSSGAPRPPGSRRPAAAASEVLFGPTLHMFDGGRLLASPRSGAGAVPAGMYVGRTVHFHFQYVDDVLAALYPRAAEASPDDVLRCGGFSPLRYVRAYAGDPLLVADPPCVAGPFATEVAIVGATPAIRKSLAARWQRGVDALTATQMAWVAALSIGAIADARECAAPGLCVATLDARSPEPGGARVAVALAERAGAILLELWIRAEAWVLHQDPAYRPSPLETRACAWMGHLVAAEVARRVALPAPVAPEPMPDAAAMLRHMDRWLPHRPLSRHLACFWYPGYRRDVLLEGSPFDFAPALAELYAGRRPPAEAGA